MNRLAVMDWGIGGLGFWKEWKKMRPGDGIVYFSDSGFEPYGKVSDDDLRSRLETVIAWLAREHGVTHLVIACNAASTVLEGTAVGEVKVRGILRAAAEEIRELVPRGPVSIAGGRRTIESGLYQRLLPGYDVNGIIAQALSAIVEAGRMDEAGTKELVGEIFEKTGPDLLLACTHYVALKKIIRSVFPDVRLHDPVPRLVSELGGLWPEMPGEDLFLTTGSTEDMIRTGKAAFGVEVVKSMASKVL